MDSKAAVVVSGEAPESDDDATITTKTNLGFQSMQTLNTCGTIISGEAPESDDEIASLSSISTAMDAMACPPYMEVKTKKCTIKYNSLLHKKLHERNEILNKDILHMSQGTIIAGIQELSNINKQLLKSELTLQEGVSQLRNACIRSKEASNVLHQLMDANFLHSIKT